MAHHAQNAKPQDVKENAAPPAFLRQTKFLLAAAEPDQFPETNLPEIAIAGRSNAGKSTLINALTGQKSLARASKMPGRTQQIIFFNAGRKLMIADLPGYGHAKAPKSATTNWTRLIKYYLKNRVSLRCVLLLIDSRHGILPPDLAAMSLLDRAGVNYQVALAKSDYLKPEHTEALQKTTANSLRKHPAARPGVMAISAKTFAGINDLREWMASLTAQA